MYHAACRFISFFLLQILALCSVGIVPYNYKKCTNLSLKYCNFNFGNLNEKKYRNNLLFIIIIVKIWKRSEIYLLIW